MDLTEYVQQVSREDFGWEFHHTAHWNNRLQTTGGRFFPKDGHLDFNPKLYVEHGLDVFRKIVRHELCHYHLYFQNKGYRHADDDFKELLKAVDGLRYAPPSQARRACYYYHCFSCGHVFARQRAVNTEKYRCGFCRGQIALRGNIE